MANSKKNQFSWVQTQTLAEKQFLDAIKTIFKRSDLLKGQPPNDKILLSILCPSLIENLKLFKNIEAALNSTLLNEDKTPANKPRKKAP